MKIKKVLCLVLSLAMVLGTINFTVFAVEGLPAAEDGLITLTEDVILSSTLEITSDVIIDLNGYKITSSDISGSEKAFSPLIKVTGSSVTLKDGGVTKGAIVPGIKEDVSSYNTTTVTIEVKNGQLTVDGAVIQGQKAINTKYGGIAISAYTSDINIVNASVVLGGDCVKKDVTSDSGLNFIYQGEAGEAIVSYGSDIVISDSEVNGGGGTISGSTPVQYIGNGVTQADGGCAVELRGSGGINSTLVAINSAFNGGESALRNPGDALNIQGSSVVNLDGCTVTGGSVNPGLGNYGIGGDGIYLSGMPTVTVKNSTITAGLGKSSTKNGALEIASPSANPTVTVEDSTLVGGAHYAIGGSGKLGSFTLIDTTIKSSGELIETGTISYITAEGILTVAEDSEAKKIGIEVLSTTGAQIIGASDITEVVAPVIPPSLPTATVSEPIINTTVMAMNGINGEAFETPVTFKMNFKADEPTDKQREYYSEWLADYELVINKDIRGVDAYLVGQYDSWSENWVKLASDTENVIVQANTPIKVVKDLMGLDLKYEADILGWVKDFDCGIYFTPEFIEANPDLKVTLALKLYNPQNPEESHVIGEAYEFSADDAKQQEIPWNSTVRTVTKMGKISIAGLSGRYGRIRLFAGIDAPSKYDKYGFKYTITKGENTMDGEIILDTVYEGRIRVNIAGEDRYVSGADLGEGNLYVMDTSLCFAPEWISTSTKITVTPFVVFNGTEYFGTPLTNTSSLF